jgi:hypothetical protein
MSFILPFWLATLSPAVSSQAGPRLWAGLEPGVHGVGYRVIDAVYESRSFVKGLVVNHDTILERGGSKGHKQATSRLGVIQRDHAMAHTGSTGEAASLAVATIVTKNRAMLHHGASKHASAWETLG